MKKKNKLFRKGVHPIVHIILIIVLLVQVYPLSTMVINSFRTDASIKRNPLGLPDLLAFDNYIATWERGGYARAYINSILVGAAVIFIIVLVAGLAAYAIVKLELPHRNFFSSYFLLVMAIPTFLYIVPVYYMFHNMHLTDNLVGLILVYSANQLPFNLMLIRTFMIGMPKELEEAARVDGCSEFKTFLKITLPLAKPIFITVALLVFVQTWNEFLWASTFLSSEEWKTVATRFVKFVGEHNRDLSKIFTSGCITLGPIIILYLFLQRQFVEGMTSGSVKA